MKIRIAKKKKVKDFREEGFLFSCHFDENHKANDEEMDKFIDLIESRSLLCACTFIAKKWEGIIYGENKFYHTTEEDKMAVREFLTNLPHCTKAGTTPNMDTNHASDKTSDTMEDETLPHWNWKVS